MVIKFNTFINSFFCFMPDRNKNGDENEMDKLEFFVRLCGDIVIEVLRFGERRRLTKMEIVGYRFHWIVENFFPEAPFLRLNLTLYPRYYLCFFKKFWSKFVTTQSTYRDK